MVVISRSSLLRIGAPLATRLTVRRGFPRMARAGYRYERAGENVARGQRTLDAVMTAWLTSPGHRRNLLGEYSEIGAAYATDEAGIPYWCVTFGTPLMR